MNKEKFGDEVDKMVNRVEYYDNICDKELNDLIDFEKSYFRLLAIKLRGYKTDEDIIYERDQKLKDLGI